MIKLLRYLPFLFALLLALPAWSESNDYRIGTSDVLSITVYSHPDLTTEARVGGGGTISFPLIGEVKLAGKTPVEGAAEIAHRLSSGGFILEPNVNLNVVQYRSQQVSVLGRVNRPGKFPLEKISRVSDVLALAGGIGSDGADTITLIREKDGKTQYREIDAIALFMAGGQKDDERVQDGDIINVPRQPLFYIYGEVQRPGSYRLEQNMSLVQALTMGGGVNLRGTQRGIKILRRDADGGMQKIEAQLSDPVKRDDVIYVKESLF
ncbi:MAG: polysaccharide export protein EpsE [Sulfuricella sp.]|jgi:polysaccharide export outer membrane protein